MARQGPSNRTTLTEVARKAGVSPATASMVLSGKGDGVRIASATAARVRAVALDLDYSPNLLVRSIQQGTSGVLGFFSAFRNLDDEDLYMDRLARGLEQAAGRRGHDLLVHCAFERTIEQTYQSVNGGRADGLLLFAPHPDDPMLILMRRSRLPCVLLNARDPEGVLPSVKDDVRGGMTELAEALVANGHQRIACLQAGSRETPDAEERIAELDAFLRSRRIQRDPAVDIDVREDLGASLAALFAQPNPPTALFCCTDRIAYRALTVLQQLEIRVPEDVSVVGYDGIRWAGDSPHIVASVAVDLKALASAAVDLLLNDRHEEREVTLPTTFQRGTTLGPAPTLQRSN